MKTKARIAGVFYLITFVAGSVSLALANGKLAADITANLAYVAVTVLFYQIFKPVNRNVSLLAAAFSLVGIINGTLTAFHRAPTTINPLVFFGFYCLLIGYLIIRSTFLPRILGVLMAIGGLGWLTFMSPTLSHSLYPYNLAPGIIGEGALTLWLLVVGLNEQRWKEQDAATA
jgi:hypothetical protein